MSEQREARHWNFDGDFGLSLLTADPAAELSGDADEARALRDDARLLLESSLPDEVLRAVWLAASGGRRDPGADPRSRLCGVVERCEEEIAADVLEPGPGTPPTVAVDENAMREAVLAEVQAVTGTPAGSGTVPVPALARVVAEVDADLGFRLFLRVLKAYAVPVGLADYDRYQAIAGAFGYPGRLVPEGLAVRWPRFDDASVRRRFEFDFGFSAVVGRFHGDLWQHAYTVDEGVRGVATDQVGLVPGVAAFALLQDTSRLLGSPLSDGTLTTLWQVTTYRGYDLDEQGGVRPWLRRITDICGECLRLTDPGFTPAAPAPAAMELRDPVLRELRDVAPAVTAAVRDSPWYGADTSPWFALSDQAVPVLEQVTGRVDPDLGFRLLLRTLSAYSVPLTEERVARLTALGDAFGHSRPHIASLTGPGH
ncbi:hypothetical protein ACIBVL_11210 [Streptomyces sp. NPDC049687]|uniref:hypothetical protein n=1 Tax=Streptomyces sp. NPDC049687 TaxID=3365596 RepID=UPI0037A296CC